MRTLYTIDAHAGGEPTRVVIGGLPPLSGETTSEKRAFLKQRFDWIRRCLTFEPRGHSDMFGAVLTEATEPEHLYALIFFDTGGYLDGCGHGTICSTAVWSRLHGVPATPFRIRNPDDSTTLVEDLERRGESGCRVSLLMPPARVIAREVHVDGAGQQSASLVQCGNRYLVLEAGSVGLTPLRDRLPQTLKSRALEIANGATGDRIARLAGGDYEVLFYERQAEDAATYATAAVFSAQQLDRSPCGTGSCALLTALTDLSALEPGDTIGTVGPAGGRFDLVQGSVSGNGNSLRVRLTGEAFITGVHEWLIDDEDPMAGGFRLG